MQSEYANYIIGELEHELALSRAGETYWRAKYIEAKRNEATIIGTVSLSGFNPLYWYERAARSPMDECDE